MQTREEREIEILACHKALMHSLKSVAPSVWANVDLSIAQVRTLSCLANGGPMVIGHLAHQLGIGVSTGGHLVDKLVQSGLVERTEDPEDRRRTLAQLTPAGEELCARLFDHMGMQMPNLIREMSEEDQAALLQGLRALVYVIEKKLQEKAQAKS